MKLKDWYEDTYKTYKEEYDEINVSTSIIYKWILEAEKNGDVELENKLLDRLVSFK